MAPVSGATSGTFCAAMMGRMLSFCGVPRTMKSANTLSSSISLRTLSGVRLASKPSSWVTSSMRRPATPPLALMVRRYTCAPAICSLTEPATGPVMPADWPMRMVLRVTPVSARAVCAAHPSVAASMPHAIHFAFIVSTPCACPADFIVLLRHGMHGRVPSRKLPHASHGSKPGKIGVLQQHHTGTAQAVPV
ncbi:hypothetical protein D9M72_216980 [compost metagenome]